MKFIRLLIKKAHPHPIVFIEYIDQVRFKACILSSKSIGNNILMNQSHFCVNDENGNPYIFQYENSFLIKDMSFIKMDYWLDGEVEGKLTEEGMDQEQILGLSINFA
ncbi:MAG: hypothetical protein WC679_13545 [Bacteroidales bacterium]